MSLEDLKLHIKEIPISEIIEHYVHLQKNGSSVVGICPFHSDTKPSMHVTDSMGIFKCFACGAAGDSITFVERHLNLDFKEALQEICKITGINYDAYVSEPKKSKDKEYGERVLDAARRIYRKIALDNCEEYQKFLKERGMTEETAQEFSIGFAPKGHTIENYINSIPKDFDRNYAMKMAKHLQLVCEDQKTHNHYDFFRSRIMFPIWDQYGGMIGFSSRIVYDWQKDKTGKYLNSKESKGFFQKSELLFGLNKAKKAIREADSVIIVEGHMDLIMMHQNGFKNSVAIMGVALSEHSIEILSRLTKNFYIGLDSDNAGWTAIKRLLPSLLKRGDLNLKFMSYAPHKDPDDLLKTEGMIEFKRRLDEAPDLLDKVLEEALPKEIPEILSKKFEVLKNAFDIVAPLGNSLEASERILKFAKSLGLNSDYQTLKSEYEKFLKDTSEKNNKPSYAPAPPPEMAVEEMPLPEELYPENMDAPLPEEMLEKPSDVKLTPREKSLFKTVIESPECFLDPDFDNILELLDNLTIRKYICELRDVYENVEEGLFPKILKDEVVEHNYPLSIRDAVITAVMSCHKLHQTVHGPKYVANVMKDLKTLIELVNIDAKLEELNAKKLECTTRDALNTVVEEIRSQRSLRQQIMTRKTY